MQAERQFNGYEVVARLATRATSAVYLARRSGMGGFARLVCLKVFRLPHTFDDDALVGFIREATIVTELRHDCCVRTDEVGSVGDISYIAMEYLAGETLAALLERARDGGRAVPDHVIAQIAARVADGLHHAHELKRPDGRPYQLVHRDVSPENVMITYEGAVKVLDFGVAKIADHIATQTGLIKGKVAYMSPEQITGQRIDRRTDIYALGIVLHEAVGNHRLYAGLTAQEIAFRAFKDPPPPLSSPLARIVACALERDPDARFSTAAEMAAALRNHLATCSNTDATDDVARYMREVFGDRHDRKRAVLEACARSTYDLAELLDVLDAKMLTNLDFPEAADDDLETDGFATTMRASAPATGPLDSHPEWTDDDAEAGTDKMNEPAAPTAPTAVPSVPTVLDAATRHDRRELLVTPVDDTAPIPPRTASGPSATQPSVVAKRRLRELDTRAAPGPFGLTPRALTAVLLGLLAGIAAGLAISLYLLDELGL